MNQNNNLEEEVWEVNVDTLNTNGVNYNERAALERRKYGRVLPLTQMVVKNMSWANKYNRGPKTPQKATRKRSPNAPNPRRVHPRYAPSPPPVERKRPGVPLNTPKQKQSKGGKRKTYRYRK
jgi:hypothetical protein